MTKPTILVAGATGAIGRPLVTRLLSRGYPVLGLTRTDEGARWLASLGCQPVVGDVYRPEPLARALAGRSVSVVIHQLTDLPFGLIPAQMDEGRRANARIRDEGTRNFLTAIHPLNARLIAQSIAFCHGDADGPFDEDDPVENESIRGFEALLLAHRPDTTILRYGPLFGPGTGVEGPPGPGGITAEMAATAAVLAVEAPRPGVFHVCGPGPYRTERARAAWPDLC